MLSLALQHHKFSMPLELLCLLPREPKHTCDDGDGPGALRDDIRRDLDLPNAQRAISRLLDGLGTRYGIKIQGFDLFVDHNRGKGARRALRIRRNDWDRANELCVDYMRMVYGKRRDL